MKFIKPLLFFVALLTATPSYAQIDQGLAQVSLYEHSVTGQDQDGKEFKLQAKQGKYVILSFFYATCEFSCPILLEALKNMDQQLKGKANTQFVLISLDPKHDTSAVLKNKMQSSKLDASRFTLVNIKDSALRELSTILDVKYRPSGKDINHSTVITILDPQGKIIFREEGIGNSIKLAVELLNKLSN